MLKTFSTNQKNIKLITNKFAITEGIIARQMTNVSRTISVLIFVFADN